jgi:hypothetical protein
MVPGDFLTYSEFFEGRDADVSIRDHAINTVEQFNQFKKNHPEKRIELEQDYRSFDWTLLENSLKFYNVFSQAPERVIIKRASKLQWEDIRNNNVLYQGSALSMHILQKLLGNTHICLNIDDPRNRDQFFLEKDGTKLIYDNIGTPHIDDHLEANVVVIKMRGPANNSILLIISAMEMARTYMIRHLTTEKLLHEFQQTLKDELGRTPEYFEVVINVKGFLMTGFEHEFLYVHELSTAAG